MANRLAGNDMDFVQVEVQSRQELRDWLAAHHRKVESIWLVTFKMGHPHYLPYAELVDEALCFGWIDSLPRKLDDARTMHLLSPRKKGSAWSAVNKAKVAALIADGLMAEPGLAAIERAKADGSWERLDCVETLELPDDLAAEFAAAEGVALENWNGFSRSSRRGILEWIALAKRPETRASRVAQTVTLAAEGRKANHPVGRDR
jgi:uncharacterized protein YdeI (YjbR/CyaY-like superfamily)